MGHHHKLIWPLIFVQDRKTAGSQCSQFKAGVFETLTTPALESHQEQTESFLLSTLWLVMSREEESFASNPTASLKVFARLNTAI